MKIQRMKTNRIVNPLGFDLKTPHVSWTVTDTEAKKQLWARVEVSKTEDFADVIFDTGACKTASSLGVPVEIALEPRTRYFWRVTVMGDNGELATSDTAWFETAKLDEPFTAQRISPCLAPDTAPYMRRAFEITGEVLSARAYFTGLGIYELYLNGEKANDAVNVLIGHLGIAVAAVVGVTWAFLGVRPALIVAVTVPLILAITLGMVNLAGLTINRLTLYGLIIALGLLVDDSIVVIENIVRHYRLGPMADRTERLRRTVDAPDEIGNATLLATIAVMLVFGMPIVALHPEGVDRNESGKYWLAAHFAVALHPEGVDRNKLAIPYSGFETRRPPPGGRG